MNITTNLKLLKPTSDLKFNVQHQNTNMDILDLEVKKLQESDKTFTSKSTFDNHTSNVDNPHVVTKEQLGLSNVINIRQIPAITKSVTENGIPIFDENGYKLKDSGFTINKSVPADAKFTDTVYEHPISPIVSGTYKSVTISETGHVISAENPTTLEDYGITNAEKLGNVERGVEQSKAYTDLQIASAQAGMLLKKKIVEFLPTENIDQNTIYLIPRSDHSDNDNYNEYINLDGSTNGWEWIGNSNINLADFYNKTESNRIFMLKESISQENVSDINTVPSSAILKAVSIETNNAIEELNRKLITTETEISPGVILYRNGSNRNLQIKGVVSGVSGVFVTLSAQDTPTNHCIGVASYGDSPNAMIGLIRVSVGGVVQLLNASRSTVSGLTTVGGVSWIVN